MAVHRPNCRSALLELLTVWKPGFKKARRRFSIDIERIEPHWFFRGSYPWDGQNDALGEMNIRTCEVDVITNGDFMAEVSVQRPCGIARLPQR